MQVPEQASLHGFSTNTHTVQQILEEAARSLKLLWRVSLPLKAAHGTAQGIQVLLGFIWAWLGVWDGFLDFGNVSGRCSSYRWVIWENLWKIMTPVSEHMDLV